MEKNTETALWREKRSLKRKFILTFFLFTVVSFPAFSQATWIDAVLAKAGASVITLRDLQAHALFSDLLQKRKPTEIPRFDDDIEAMSAALQQTIDRAIVHQYIASTLAIPPIKEEDLTLWRENLPKDLQSRDSLEKYFEGFGFSKDEVNQVIREFFEMDRFLEERFMPQVKISESDLQEAYLQGKDTSFLGREFQDVRKVVETKVRRDRLALVFQTWLEEERKRLSVTILPNLDTLFRP